MKFYHFFLIVIIDFRLARKLEINSLLFPNPLFKARVKASKPSSFLLSPPKNEKTPESTNTDTKNHKKLTMSFLKHYYQTLKKVEHRISESKLLTRGKGIKETQATVRNPTGWWGRKREVSIHLQLLSGKRLNLMDAKTMDSFTKNLDKESINDNAKNGKRRKRENSNKKEVSEESLKDDLVDRKSSPILAKNKHIASSLWHNSPLSEESRGAKITELRPFLYNRGKQKDAYTLLPPFAMIHWPSDEKEDSRIFSPHDGLRKNYLPFYEIEKISKKVKMMKLKRTLHLQCD